MSIILQVGWEHGSNVVTDGTVEDPRGQGVLAYNRWRWKIYAVLEVHVLSLPSFTSIVFSLLFLLFTSRSSSSLEHLPCVSRQWLCFYPLFQLC
jgi:hypothetical protein